MRKKVIVIQGKIDRALSIHCVDHKELVSAGEFFGITASKLGTGWGFPTSLIKDDSILSGFTFGKRTYDIPFKKLDEYVILTTE